MRTQRSPVAEVGSQGSSQWPVDSFGGGTRPDSTWGWTTPCPAASSHRRGRSRGYRGFTSAYEPGLGAVTHGRPTRETAPWRRGIEIALSSGRARATSSILIERPMGLTRTTVSKLPGGLPTPTWSRNPCTPVPLRRADLDSRLLGRTASGDRTHLEYINHLKITVYYNILHIVTLIKTGVADATRRPRPNSHSPTCALDSPSASSDSRPRPLRSASSRRLPPIELPTERVSTCVVPT